MKGLPPSLSWTLNLTIKWVQATTWTNFIFLTPCFFHNSFTLKLLVYLCMYFFLALSCYYALLSLCWFYNFVLQWCFTIATCPTLLLRLTIISPCCYELHLATVMGSTLLLPKAPPCYMLYFVVVTPPVIVVLLLLLLCLPFYLVMLLFNLATFPPLILFYLIQTPMASLETLVVALPYYNFALLLLYLVATTGFLCLPNWYFHTSLFPCSFGFFNLKKQTKKFKVSSFSFLSFFLVF